MEIAFRIQEKDSIYFIFANSEEDVNDECISFSFIVFTITSYYTIYSRGTDKKLYDAMPHQL